MSRKTKIIATLGPASDGEAEIRKLIERGMDVARINCSHGTHADHARRVEIVRRVSSDLDRPIAVMQDIQGPKIRVGEFPGGSVEIEDGAEVTLVPGEGVGTSELIHIAYLDRVEMSVGGTILLADGLITLEAIKVAPDEIRTRVVVGGELLDHKGAAFPAARTTIPVVTAKDEIDLAFGRKLGVDAVAASFVTKGEDLRTIREHSGNVSIIAKIETAVGYMNLDDILPECTGAMVARGDLGVELSIQSVPRAQAEILRRTNAAGKVTITATEMLESMIHSSRPTRAEVTDVYRSVIDGTDAVMLSAETAIGEHPSRAVKLMADIVTEAEKSPDYGRQKDLSGIDEGAAFASATAEAAVDTADRLGLDSIVAFTESGTTARLLSKYRPDADVYAFTPIESTYRQMAMLGAVQPMLLDRVDSTDEMFAVAERELLRRGIARDGDGIVMIAGVPPNQRSSTNLMKLHVIGSGDVLHPDAEV
ncbi:MAG: pyruvate kinase [Acidimicrobiia bacterium]|nr:pyruvate kinase [Acidimicrobiia bacterium]